MSGDRELKFLLPAGRLDFARRWLAATCRPDPRYPRALVSTIYYDSRGQCSLREKANSDYLKLKVRLRWYTELDGRITAPAFVEAKARHGTRRLKHRVPVPIPAAELASWHLDDPRLRALPELLRDAGVLTPDAWRPSLRLRYRRDRFVDAATRARLCLDGAIVAEACRRDLVPVVDRSPLGVGVIEVKGDAGGLPPAVRALVRLGARRAAFSKYLAVHRHLAHGAA